MKDWHKIADDLFNAMLTIVQKCGFANCHEIAKYYYPMYEGCWYRCEKHKNDPYVFYFPEILPKDNKLIYYDAVIKAIEEYNLTTK